ncbi:MAG: tRNA pseudouridine(55) synthase TruB [Pseudomonadota bacterium]
MSRRRRGDPVHGVVLLDKPAGLSSNQALQRVRHLFNARKAGHTGTLDPFATGLLPLCFGEASKTTAFLLDAVKAYRAVAILGEATTTGDLDGEPIASEPLPQVNPDAVRAVMAQFTGELEQVPPMYSALKFEGKPLYEYARQGIEIPRQPRPVTIHELELIEWRPPRLGFEVVCSKGTYVRTLAEDIASALGTVGHLVALERLQVGPFRAEDMVPLEALEQAAKVGELGQHLMPVDAGLPDWPVVVIDGPGSQAFRNGNPAPAETEGAPASGWVRVRDVARIPLGLGEIADGMVHPKRVFQLDG